MRHVTIQETLAGGNTSSYMTGDRIIGTLDLMNPDQHTIHEHMLDVGHGHTLYVHDWGNKAAKMPIFFLHGGPGGQGLLDGGVHVAAEHQGPPHIHGQGVPFPAGNRHEALAQHDPLSDRHSIELKKAESFVPSWIRET